MKNFIKKTGAYVVVLALLLVVITALSACGEDCEHDWGVWQVSVYPNWEAGGLLYRRCSECGQGQNDWLPSFSEAGYYSERVLREPTCTVMGESEFTLLNSEYDGKPLVLVVNTPKAPHDLSVFKKHTSAEHEVSCSVCEGYKYEAHNLTHTVTLEPTCSSKGKEDVLCSDCGYEAHDREIAELEHDMSFVDRVEATCLAPGHSGGDVCSVCGYLAENVTVYPICACAYESGECKWCKTKCEHDWGVWQVSVYPNWEAGGLLYRRCSECGQGQNDWLPSFSEAGYYSERVLREPTCTVVGESEFTLLNSEYDGKPLVLVVNTPKAPHDLSVFKKHTSAEHEVSCSVCEGYKYEAHNLTHTVTLEPTCTSKGKEDVYCSDCGYEAHDREIAELSHDMAFVDRVEATCLAPGHSGGDACSVCGHFAENVTVYPICACAYEVGECKWCKTKQPIKVTYVYNDTESEEKNLLYGDPFEYINAGSDNNRIFVGWYTSDGVLYSDGTALTSSVTLYARWDIAIHITTREQFLAIKDDPTASYYLDADIDLRGALLSPVELFSGILDGYCEEENRNYTVKNFIMTADGEVGAYGIFSTNTGSIRNITFKDFTFSGNVTCKDGGAIGGVCGVNDGEMYGIILDGVILAPSLYKSGLEGNTFSVGLLAGRNSGYISACEIEGEMNVFVDDYTYRDWYSEVRYNRVRKIGGAVGDNLGEICDTYAEVDIDLETKARNGNPGHVHVVLHAYYGGFVGHNRDSGEINGSYAKANLTLKSHGSSGRSHDITKYGGFVGLSDNSSTISECFAKGTMTGNTSTGNRIGGFVGENTATASISSSYSEVDVSLFSGSDVISGGFAGYNTALIQNSYSTGDVSSSVAATLGGFVGFNAKGGTVTKTYTTSNVSATDGNAGVYAGINEGIVSKSYTADSVIFKPGSSTLGTMALTTEVTSIGFSELISENHLTGKLYWDLEGWYIGSDNHPFLEWEFLQLHNYGEPTVIHPTCTEAGFTVYECRVCASAFITDIIAPLGHNNVDNYEEGSWRAPTHSECGMKAYVCEHEEYGIFHTYTVEVAPLGHDKAGDISCGELIENGGKYYHKCSCSTELNEVLIEVNRAELTHKPKNVSYTAPSCGTKDAESGEWDYTAAHAGNKAGRVCEDCGYVIAGCDIILPHTFSHEESVEEASCDKEGSLKRICSVCEYVDISVIEKTEHTYEGGKPDCTVCGEARFTIDQSFTPISSLSDLKNMIPNGNYYLTADIDLESVAFKPLFSEEDPFIGIFLGNGYSIKNLRLEAKTEENYLGGIFAKIGGEGKVVGLNIDGVSVYIENVNGAKVGIIAGINGGEISLCTVSGEIEVELLTLSRSQTVGEFAHSFDFVFGGIVGENARHGEINASSVKSAIKLEMDVLTELNATNVSGYFSQLINNTRITNHTDIVYGGFVGTNNGKITGSSVEGETLLNMRVSSVVGGINRGRTFTFLNLSAGGFVGINTADIVDCRSTRLLLGYHDKTKDSFVSDNSITVLGVVLKQEYYEIVDHSVFEDNLGMIGQSTPSGKVDGLDVVIP